MKLEHGGLDYDIESFSSPEIEVSGAREDLDPFGPLVAPASQNHVHRKEKISHI